LKKTPFYWPDKVTCKAEYKSPIQRFNALTKSWNNADYDQYFQPTLNSYLEGLRLSSPTPFTIESIMKWIQDLPLNFCHDFFPQKTSYNLDDINKSVEYMKDKGMDKMDSVEFIIKNVKKS
jgi:hypothetical protein